MKRWIPQGAAALLMAGTAVAQDATDTGNAPLEQRVDALARELERAQFGSVVPPVGESRHGLGPAASKVYDNRGGLSIGGYGEVLYERFDGDTTDQADMLRAILYFGFKFDDKWLVNTEIELEHANEAFVEFAYLDYLHSEALNFRAGLLLVPVGLVNELHEPNMFLGARRPDVEGAIIPSTWRENGVGVFGALGDVSYKAYIVTGMDGEGFTAGGLRGGRQKGSKAKAEDFAGVVRLDWHAAPGVLVGGSVYSGNAGHDLGVGAMTTITEAHIDVRRRGLQFRALAVQAEVDDVADLNRILAAPGTADADIASIGEELEGYYVELGYDVLNLFDTGEQSLIPFVRFEAYDTQAAVPAGFAASGARDVEVVTVGVNYKPRDEIVFKADVQTYDNEAGTGEDQFNLAAGYVF